jgi:hypothetical protein
MQVVRSMNSACGRANIGSLYADLPYEYGNSRPPAKAFMIAR